MWIRNTDIQIPNLPVLQVGMGWYLKKKTQVFVNFSYFHQYQVWICIWILLFSSLTSKMPSKSDFLTQFFCLLVFKLHLHHFFKDLSPREVTKQQESRFFFPFLLHFCCRQQCCGSMTFWGGSGFGSSDPCLLISSLTYKMPAKTNFLTQFCLLITFKLHLHHFSKIKSQQESQNSRNQDFSY